MLNQVKVGPQIATDGSLPDMRGGRQGEAMISQIMPRFYEMASRQNIFVAAVSGVTTTVGLNTTYTGLILSNTPGSGKLLVPIRFGFAQSVINAAVNAFGLLAGHHPSTLVTHTTPAVPRSTYIQTAGSPAPVGLCDSSATLPVAPTWVRFFNSTPTATTNPNGVQVDLDGEFVLAPGSYLGLGAVAASPASAIHAAISWMEVPI